MRSRALLTPILLCSTYLFYLLRFKKNAYEAYESSSSWRCDGAFWKNAIALLTELLVSLDCDSLCIKNCLYVPIYFFALSSTFLNKLDKVCPDPHINSLSSCWFHNPSQLNVDDISKLQLFIFSPNIVCSLFNSIMWRFPLALYNVFTLRPSLPLLASITFDEEGHFISAN